MNQVSTAAIAATVNVITIGRMRMRGRGTGAVVVCATTSGGALGLFLSGRSSAVDISGPDLQPAARLTTARSCRPKKPPTPDATRDATGHSDSQLAAAESV